VAVLAELWSIEKEAVSMFFFCKVAVAVDWYGRQLDREWQWQGGSVPINRGDRYASNGMRYNVAVAVLAELRSI
jgi:hypothetical protein